MSEEITKHENNGVQRLTHYNVLLQPNALQEAENELLEAINKALLTCYFELNLAMPSELDRNILINKIMDTILEKFPSMRKEEIPTAFSKGIRKEYGEFYGLCLISFEQFITGYLTSETRRKLVKERDKLYATSSEPGPDEKFTTAKNLCLEAYNQVKVNKVIGLTAVTVYTFINSLGLIDKDYKKGVMQNALQLLVDEKEKDIAFCMDLIKRRQMGNELEHLKQNIANDILTPAQHAEVQRVAKKHVITNYLRDISLDDTDLAELIEGKREFYRSAK